MRNTILIIFGKKGSGKTYFIKKLLKKLSSYIIIDVLGEYTDIYLSDIKDLNDLGEQHKVRIIPLNQRDFEDCLFKIFKRGNTTLILDELTFWDINIDIIEKIFRFGRHKNLNVIVTTRRPYELTRIITAMSDIFIIFKITEPRDLDYLKSINIDVEKITQLKKYDALYYDFINTYEINANKDLSPLLKKF